MNTKDIAVEYRLSKWAQVIQDRKESGQSIKAYCKSEGIHENAYYYWLKRLRETAWEELAKSNDVGLSIPSPRFVEVTPPEQPVLTAGGAQENHVCIEVSGIRITADGGYAVSKLAGLVREVARS